MDKGFVQLPLERYDELMGELAYLREQLDVSVPAEDYEVLEGMVYDSIEVEKSYTGAPRVIIKLKYFRDIIEEKLRRLELEGTYKLVRDEMRIWDLYEREEEDEDR